MTYDEFERKLRSLNLNKKNFARMVDMSYTSVTNWKQPNNVPKWVDSWLHHYEKSKILDEFMDSIDKYNKLNNQ